jgi:hypothetical protein
MACPERAQNVSVDALPWTDLLRKVQEAAVRPAWEREKNLTRDTTNNLSRLSASRVNIQ